MKTVDTVLAVLWFAILFFGVLAEDACAYLDPGTGSLVVQAILAAVAGALVTIRIWGKRVGAFFSGLTGGNRDKEKHG